jgi:hypothetical protein
MRRWRRFGIIVASVPPVGSLTQNATCAACGMNKRKPKRNGQGRPNARTTSSAIGIALTKIAKRHAEISNSLAPCSLVTTFS